MQKFLSVAPKLGLIIILILPAVVIQIYSKSSIVTDITSFVHVYLPVYIAVLFLLKALSIVYPPLPGVVLTLGSIPFIGWELAYLTDISGSMVGATISFYLGSKYGYTILNRLFGKTIADKIASIKLKQKNQIEAALFLRFASGGMLSDALAWGASLIGFKYVPFIVGYGISHVITTAPVFYFIAASISFDSWMIVAGAAIIAWLIIYKLKGRYFE